MEKSTRAAELTTLLESRITNFYTNFQVDEIGRVVSVGDGIARVYGLNEIQAGEMVEFASGIALNLENENENVGIVVFGSDTAIKEGDQDLLLKPNYANVMEEDLSPSDSERPDPGASPSDSERPDPGASPSGNAQAKPWNFKFGYRDGPPDQNEMHLNPSYEEIKNCIDEEASLSESELPAPDGVSKALRSLRQGQGKLPDLNEALSPEKEEEKEALVSRILKKSRDYLKIREELAENAWRKLKNRQAFAQCEKFLRGIPDYLSDRKKKRAREDSDSDIDEEF